MGFCFYREAVEKLLRTTGAVIAARDIGVLLVAATGLLAAFAAAFADTGAAAATAGSGFAAEGDGDADDGNQPQTTESDEVVNHFINSKKDDLIVFWIVKRVFEVMEPTQKQVMKLTEGPCKICGEPDYALLDVHRIVPGLEGGNYDKWNTVVVCCKCHRRIHAGQIKTYRWLYSTSGKYVLHCEIDGEERFI